MEENKTTKYLTHQEFMEEFGEEEYEKYMDALIAQNEEDVLEFEKLLNAEESCYHLKEKH